MAKKIIETLEFNDALHAQKTIEKAETALKKIKRALIPAAISTASFLISTTGIIPNSSVNGFLLTLSLIVAIVSYIMGGGFKIAVKTAGKLAVVGWFICPFPVDIAVGLCTMIFAVAAFFFLPIVFVFLNYRQHKKNLEDAQEYLARCVQANNNHFNYANATPVDYVYPNPGVNVNAPCYTQPTGACPPPFVG